MVCPYNSLLLFTCEKKSEALIHATTGMDTEKIRLNGTGQKVPHFKCPE